MRIVPARLKGVLLVEPDLFADERGFFLEAYNQRRMADAGIFTGFVQDNHSRSVRHTIRGLHYQDPPGQVKLVRAARGRVWDVVVDIRQESDTFGQWEAFDLDDIAHRQVYVPIGFAHGFCALSEEADVCYKVSSPYDPTLERGIAWDDPRIGITWPTSEPFLSERDLRNPRLEELIRSDG